MKALCHGFCDQLLFYWTMLPLRLRRIFDYQQPKADQDLKATADRAEPSRAPPSGSEASDAGKPVLVERRSQVDRRHGDRREKQQATFLNTRKPQGRRHSAGRRESDQGSEMRYKRISIKG